MGVVFSFHGALENQIQELKAGVNDAHKDVSHKTVFNELLHSQLSSSEKSIERLKQEGGSVVAAGVETTATALSKGLFWILSNPQVEAALRAELRPVFPNPSVTPTLAALEALPYLSAVVNETLRLSIGISSRTIRKSRRGPVVYRGRDGGAEWVIPAGAYFSMTTYYTHMDPVIWGHDAAEFRPGRWLRPEDGKSLQRFLIPFGRGPRMCLGTNLARAELFIGLAVVLRRCENLSLFETGEEDVAIKADYFIPFPHRKSQGVRVTVQ